MKAAIIIEILAEFSVYREVLYLRANLLITVITFIFNKRLTNSLKLYFTLSFKQNIRYIL